mgnify:CR=1 FL=1
MHLKLEVITYMKIILCNYDFYDHPDLMSLDDNGWLWKQETNIKEDEENKNKARDNITKMFGL